MNRKRARSVLNELNRKLLLLCSETKAAKRALILESILDKEVSEEEKVCFEDLCIEKQLKILLGLEE